MGCHIMGCHIMGCHIMGYHIMGYHMHNNNNIRTESIETGDRALSQYKDCLYRYGDSHYKDKAVEKPSYLYNRNLYIVKTESLYWDAPRFAGELTLGHGFRCHESAALLSHVTTPAWARLVYIYITSMHISGQLSNYHIVKSVFIELSGHR